MVKNVKLKLNYIGKQNTKKELKYDIADVFPVGDGLIGIEVVDSFKNLDLLVTNTFNRNVFTEYGENTYHFILVAIDRMYSGNTRILLEKQH